MTYGRTVKKNLSHWRKRTKRLESDYKQRVIWGVIMDKRILQVAVRTLLLTTRALSGLSQTSSELKNFLSKKIGLSQDQIVAIQHGKPFAKNVRPRSPAEIFVLGVIYVNAAPESYVKFATDFDRLSKFPEYLAINKFSDPPQLSDLHGFGFGRDDIRP